jgi:diguanylate cyclase (GGDEF)-like protein
LLWEIAMNCKRALALISARIDREINLVDDEALRLHLEECPRCRKRLEALRRQEQALARAFAPEREAAAALTDRILAHLYTHDPAIQPRCTILVVDDKPYILDFITRTLSEEYDVLLADSGAAAQELFRHKRIDLILSDQQMPDMTGLQLLEWVFRHHPRTMRLLMTGYDEVKAAVQAFNRGHIFRYLEKPSFGPEGLLATVRDAARTFQLERNHEHVLKELRALNDELELRVAQRTRQLEEVNTELEQKNLMLERFALNDALTGLPNRRALDYLMERELRWRERYPAPLTVGIVDIDHFKDINTRYLHPGGDKVLTDLAKCLTDGLRKIDVLGRLGGEEFLLIAPQANQAGGRVLAERIRAQVEARVFTYRDPRSGSDQVIPVRVSIGLAVLELGVAADYEQVKLAAAAALKRAKDLGRNRVEVQVLAPARAEERPAAGPGVASA